jgi:hypothetical protein
METESKIVSVGLDPNPDDQPTHRASMAARAVHTIRRAMRDAERTAAASGRDVYPETARALAQEESEFQQILDRERARAAREQNNRDRQKRSAAHDKE